MINKLMPSALLKSITALTLILTLLASCGDDSSETKENPLGLPNTISELYQDGSAVGELKGTFKYSGSKLLEIYYNVSQKKVFTYNGNLITKMEHYQAGELRYEHSYTYENGKLIRYENNDLLTGDRDLINYTHEPDGTITYLQEFSFNGTPTWQKEGILTFENGNLVEDLAEFSFNNVTDEFNLVLNVLDYDDKPNPYQNVTGYNALLNLKGTIGNQNIISDYTYTTSFKDEVQFAESLTGKEYEITYDTKGRAIQLDRYSNENIGGNTLYLDRIYKFTY
jgi:hypothetical protein